MSECQCQTNNKNQAASLGCGTLILIALIVIIFGGSNTAVLEAEVDHLRDQVSALQTQQTETIRLLEMLVMQAEPRPALPASP